MHDLRRKWLEKKILGMPKDVDQLFKEIYDKTEPIAELTKNWGPESRDRFLRLWQKRETESGMLAITKEEYESLCPKPSRTEAEEHQLNTLERQYLRQLRRLDRILGDIHKLIQKETDRNRGRQR